MDASNQQSSAKNDLLKNAKSTLEQAATHYANFKNINPLPEMAEASGNVDEKYQQYHAALAELVQFLENGNMDAYFAQPTQGMQNALGEALGKYAGVSENCTARRLMRARGDYHFAQWQLGILAVVLVLILVVVWYGIRHTLLNPLARVIAHIRDIASGNLTNTLTVSGRNEIGELAGTVDHMQRSLIETVTQVREGSDAIYSGTSEIATGTTDLSSRTEPAGIGAGRDGCQHGTAHRDGETERRQRPSGVAPGAKRLRHCATRRGKWWMAWSTPCMKLPTARRRSPTSSVLSTALHSRPIFWR
ncbi:methyl-accepting chemotaxis protein II (aspartate chemoreceptor protein) [Citrobacter koseri]|uniref:Methyl-accepting chemotaxis protein II (Aspartate chemoreceptor protein) n=1 Tax=Citrobacter koseri TaxID=545 RepID=A0A447UGQ8_CITKO|nr:methyl-accepting chemotaxis protein II (aspartate chemoreceptor protein) [Citrobacter koseri]